ncbi:MAG: YicC/YloC family endoribonuclease [Pseudobdellovibrionaceae bacterium]
MTGFGQGRAQSPILTIDVSIKSVNGRFLEPRFHMPREYSFYENELKKTVSEKFVRGHVDVFISRKVKSQSFISDVVVDVDLGLKYHQALKKLAKQLKIPAKVGLDFVARLPDVVKIENTHEISTEEKKLLSKAFLKACEGCLQERLREGAFLQKDLEKNLQALDAEVQKMADLREKANALLQDKWLQRWKSRSQALTNEVQFDESRWYQEVTVLLEKADINEELSRLQEHLLNYKNLLSSPAAEGKKLDFYTQELLREVNTIGSKSQVSVLTQAVVEAKTLIERLREQVQNAQ